MAVKQWDTQHTSVNKTKRKFEFQIHLNVIVLVHSPNLWVTKLLYGLLTTCNMYNRMRESLWICLCDTSITEPQLGMLLYETSFITSAAEELLQYVEFLICMDLLQS